ncbi:PREDICTED: RNA polymerase sigma factor sigA isoform X2 [Camelina sativa]|uniref:RNA polymerase sigma factor sigA isoform X1 n=1 Tax=Camelina sativa TaxID=90675 RepID=A0ABM1RR91_CAMSA|nr:PREDICTED: RNA polymerase sigma factor sigA isoform X1 [Camelina sativa]XP_019101530.1 PREDICTED: RNA polymerase sigma factor sigA isoform X1 [Camelina sativa]XP_019101531.1 PREDICTED: RNA polymerase sigma factor sigA isoform X1 [Camelina sativa]XP_019101532.1 PREDICTED: RNA polymerase sigma factor sigA isoform X1 [Camelina sativa]XP_019101533.1 PREDICTED: RNA polymerase sigma factor sigA isoform X2 [Camelina sativa]XP_019101534.1 PREDICTED: RNA polymerase sigma factor sigA isoform X1 [Came
MMATAAVIGLNTGKRLLSSSFYHSDVTDRFLSVNDHCSSQYHIASTKSGITAKKASSSNYSPNFPSSNRHTQSAKALTESVDVASTEQPWVPTGTDKESEEEEDCYDDDDLLIGHSVEALLLLQKSMLEKSWNLSFDKASHESSSGKRTIRKKKIPVITCSGISARQRRIGAKKKTNMMTNAKAVSSGKQVRSVMSSDLFQHNRVRGYVKGVISEDVLSHSEVVRLSKKIKSGLRLDDHKSRLKDRLGCEPSDEQLAISLKISRAELQAWLMECHLAREKLAMSNVRLVLSIAQRYDNMGAEMSDLVQGGLIGLLRGIEKFDSSKGFRISTYVYWWIRQGVSRALVDNSRTLRLPTHLHERLGLIRNAKLRLQEKGITPSIDRIAESLNMSQKKVRNATEAVSKIFSLDRDAFPSLNGLPGETHHSYIADNRLENNPWYGYDEWALKEEVSKLISATLGEREREIIRLYYGLDKECLTWEDISKRIGLSRERVRQVGLVALEKLKHAARKRKMEAMILKNCFFFFCTFSLHESHRERL